MLSENGTIDNDDRDELEFDEEEGDEEDDDDVYGDIEFDTVSIGIEMVIQQPNKINQEKITNVFCLFYIVQQLDSIL